MSFSNLPQELQDLYIVNIELALKIFFISLITFLCFHYISKLKRMEKTPYILVAQGRALLGFMSYFVLYSLPFVSLFIFYPQFGINSLQQGVMYFYWISTIVIMFIFIINILTFSTSWLVGLVGFDINARKTNQVMNDLSRLSGGIKFKANVIRNKVSRWFD